MFEIVVFISQFVTAIDVWLPWTLLVDVSKMIQGKDNMVDMMYVWNCLKAKMESKNMLVYACICVETSFQGIEMDMI